MRFIDPSGLLGEAAPVILNLHFAPWRQSGGLTA
jgi:hypothetical protein